MSPTKKSKNAQPKASRPYMPGYGLPRGTNGLLPWSWAEQRLKKSHNYWITTVRPDGSPHTMVVWGLWLDGALYFSTGKQSRKARNLAQNPRCVICTEHANEAVIIQGEAHPTKVSPELKFAANYKKKYHWDISAMPEEPVYQVRPQVAFGLYEKKFVQTATRWNLNRGERC